MDPYFTAINRPVPEGTMTIMLLSDFQLARTGGNFFSHASGQAGASPTGPGAISLSRHALAGATGPASLGARRAPGG